MHITPNEYLTHVGRVIGELYESDRQREVHEWRLNDPGVIARHAASVVGAVMADRGIQVQDD